MIIKQLESEIENKDQIISQLETKIIENESMNCFLNHSYRIKGSRTNQNL